MNEFYDNLETRDIQQRASEQLEALIQQLKHARQHAPAYAELDIEAINSLEDFAKLPLTRKSSLLELQKDNPPFGGYSAIPAPRLSNIFASPGLKVRVPSGAKP